MRFPLWLKIFGAFTLVVLLSLSITVEISNRIVQSKYKQFAATKDVNRARFLAPMLGKWTEDASEALEKGESIKPLPGMFNIPKEKRRMFQQEPRVDNPSHHRDMQNNQFQRRGMDRRMDNDVFDPFIVTDLQGRVLADNAYYGKKIVHSPERDSLRVLIENNEKSVGFLYLGSMIPNAPRMKDVPFIYMANTRIWFVSAVVFLFALAMGTLLTWSIVKPIKMLKTAALDVEKGRLSTRVSEHRRDELGDLACGFNAMTKSLDQADQQRRRLIADSAHELRTPVSLIRTRIEMMEEGLYALNAESLAALSREAGRLSNLVEELKLLSSMDSGTSSMDVELVNMADLVLDVVNAAQPSAEKKNIKIQILFSRKDKRELTVSGNREKLHRLMVNLVDNALKYSDGRIIVRGTRLQQSKIPSIDISVEDNGSGIPKAEREKIFERYYRGDPSRSRATGGTGLGLAICLEIVKQHRGKIRAGFSEELEGGAFFVTLPLGKV